MSAATHRAPVAQVRQGTDGASMRSSTEVTVPKRSARPFQSCWAIVSSSCSRPTKFHHIDTRAREFFYWCAVLATFALGTAVGDLTATTFGLGYLASGILFGVLFAIPGAAYRWWGLGATAAFWTSYVLTRPFGASISDWLAMPHARGGLDLGTGPVSLVLFVAIAVCVILLSARRPADPATSRGPSITTASAATTQALPAHCQGETVSPSVSMPAANPITGTPRLKGATRLAGWRLSSPVHSA